MTDLSKKHVMMLLERVPADAENLVLLGARIYFTMPRDWSPSNTSGIFQAYGRSFRSHRGKAGSRWQVRL